MDLKDTLAKWHTGMCLLDSNKSLDEAISVLLSIRSPSSKIIHNIGCIKMKQGLFLDAILCFNQSLEKDKYLALSYFQRGVCYYETQRFDGAELDFLTAQSMCPKDGINYRQLGADFVLSPELLGECLKVTRETLSLRRSGQFPKFDSDRCLFRPPKKMVDNLVKQDFLGKAKVISSTAEQDILYATDKMQNSSSAPRRSAQSSPSASTHQKIMVTPSGAKIVVPPRPTRPPPNLPATPDSRAPITRAGQRLVREKSRSAEDILDGGESQGYSLASCVGTNSSGSRLDMRADLASVLLSQRMTSGQAVTLPARRSDKSGKGLHVGRLDQDKPHFAQDGSASEARQDPKMMLKMPSPVGGAVVRPGAGQGTPADESAGKKSVRELANSFSQSGFAGPIAPGPRGDAKPLKPPRPPPPKIKP
ncbi:hypothetical protein EGW08_011818 [Elysia chlorotica]|uniref:Uncharacterized protein n=1 Tax=Elysia chlorotica TaxID=188477 RepID=A0A3S0ZLE1_ELYCH|nr:hypothetical protein EGW08_011818 [Elysia chlorotica]